MGEKKNMIDDVTVCHVPVLYNEALEMMNISQGGIVMDCTFGCGGHSKLILKKIGESGKLLALDRDSEMIKFAAEIKKDNENFYFSNDRFSNICERAKEIGINEFDAIIFDLGLSSWQIDISKRGFSYEDDGMLDMRMSGEDQLMAADILQNWEYEQLFNIFKNYGDLKEAKRLAKIIISSRRAHSYQSIEDLRRVLIDNGFAQKSGRNVWGRVWQSLRMAVNDEIFQLQSGLQGAAGLLKKGGRLVVISFHSIEDRIVKDFIGKNVIDCVCPKDFPKCNCDHRAILKNITKKPIVPTKEEINNNSRSHSAKMRVAEKI